MRAYCCVDVIARGSQLNNELTRLVFPWPGPRMLCAGESGLASWQDDVDRPGAHGVNSLSGLRGYGGGVNEQRVAAHGAGAESTDEYCTD